MGPVFSVVLRWLAHHLPHHPHKADGVVRAPHGVMATPSGLPVMPLALALFREHATRVSHRLPAAGEYTSRRHLRSALRNCHVARSVRERKAATPRRCDTRAAAGGPAGDEAAQASVWQRAAKLNKNPSIGGVASRCHHTVCDFATPRVDVTRALPRLPGFSSAANVHRRSTGLVPRLARMVKQMAG